MNAKKANSFWILLIALTYWSVALPRSAAADSEVVKAFISHPPVVSDCVYREKGRMYPRAPMGIDRLLHARWSSNVFYLREIASTNDLTNFNVLTTLVSRVESEYWMHNPNLGGYVYANPDKGGTGGDFPIKVWEGEFMAMLRMGIRGFSATNEVSWQGSTNFVAKTTLGVPIRGTLLVSSDGRATGLRLEYNNRPDGVMDVEYRYAAPVGVPGLPNEISITDVTGELRAEYVILSLRTNTAELESSAASIVGFIKGTPKAMFIHTNGQEVYVGTSDDPYTTWSPVPFARELRPRGNRWIWGIMTVVLLTPFVYFAVKKTKEMGKPKL